jgi:hypothetical protein
MTGEHLLDLYRLNTRSSAELLVRAAETPAGTGVRILVANGAPLKKHGTKRLPTNRAIH